MRRRPRFLHHIILPEGFYTCSQSHPVLQRNVRAALKHPLTDMRTHKQCEKRLCVSYCWRRCRHSWEGCVLCNQQQSSPFALDFLSSSVLQKEKKNEKRDKDRDIFRRRSRLWFPWQSHTSPHSSSSKAQKQNSK